GGLRDRQATRSFFRCVDKQTSGVVAARTYAAYMVPTALIRGSLTLHGEIQLIQSTSPVPAFIALILLYRLLWLVSPAYDAYFVRTILIKATLLSHGEHQLIQRTSPVPAFIALILIYRIIWIVSSAPERPRPAPLIALLRRLHVASTGVASTGSVVVHDGAY